MGRQRRTAFEDLVAAAAALPWWSSVVLGVGSYVFLSALANGQLLRAAEPNQLTAVVVRSMVIGFANLAQWVVPVVFALGAVLGLMRRVKAAKVVASAEGGDFGAPVTWREFEALVGEIYRRQGYRVATTPGGADGGVDLVFSREDGRFLVQCKHWQARLVDVRVVRELKGVIAATGAAGGAVVTSGAFTRDAIKFAEQARIDLVDGSRLQALARQLSSRKPSDETRAIAPVPALEGGAMPEPDCPQCGAGMVLRTAKRGTNIGQRFWGCASYPTCRGTRRAD